MDEYVPMQYVIIGGVILIILVALINCGLSVFVAIQFENALMSDWFLGGTVVLLIFGAFLIDHKHIWFTKLLIACTVMTYLSSAISLLYGLEMFNYLKFYYPLCRRDPTFDKSNCLCGTYNDKIAMRYILAHSNCDNQTIEATRVHCLSCIFGFLNMFGIFFFLLYLFFSLGMEEETMEFEKMNMVSNALDNETNMFLKRKKNFRMESKFKKSDFAHAAKKINFRMIDVPGEVIMELKSLMKTPSR